MATAIVLAVLVTAPPALASDSPCFPRTFATAPLADGLAVAADVGTTEAGDGTLIERRHRTRVGLSYGRCPSRHPDLFSGSVAVWTGAAHQSTSLKLADGRALTDHEYPFDGVSFALSWAPIHIDLDQLRLTADFFAGVEGLGFTTKRADSGEYRIDWLGWGLEVTGEWTAARASLRSQHRPKDDVFMAGESAIVGASGLACAPMLDRACLELGFEQHIETNEEQSFRQLRAVVLVAPQERPALSPRIALSTTVGGASVTSIALLLEASAF